MVPSARVHAWGNTSRSVSAIGLTAASAAARTHNPSDSPPGANRQAMTAVMSAVAMPTYDRSRGKVTAAIRLHLRSGVREPTLCRQPNDPATPRDCSDGGYCRCADVGPDDEVMKVGRFEETGWPSPTSNPGYRGLGAPARCQVAVHAYTNA